MSRAHHYVFGHVALRQVFFENPLGCVGILAERGEEMLKDLWSSVGEAVEQEMQEERLSPVGLKAELRKIGPSILAMIVTLPKPEEVPEAHFAGMIVSPPKKRLWGLLGQKRGLTRYITLEHGMNFPEDTARTVLCEWAGDRHLNMGDGPEPTLEAFALTLCRMVGGDAPEVVAAFCPNAEE